MRNRIEEIKSKGFNLVQGGDANRQMSIEYPGIGPIDFSRMKIGAKTLDDAILKLGDLNKVNPQLADKAAILNAINSGDLKTMRATSDFFYKISGIYKRIVQYMAFNYRYDWYVSVNVKDKKIKEEKVLDGFYKSLDILDNFKVKKMLGEISLSVLKSGSYYGYKVKNGDTFALQELPQNYCRVRFFKGNKPAVEFNMKFFDDSFRDVGQRLRILKMFPEEFSKGYTLYKQGKLAAEFIGDTAGWYLLTPENTVRFTNNGEEIPPFISTIPLILDLDEAQALDRKKTMQKLLKIVIQKMPMDKNGDLIFDIDEAQQLHNNAVQMLQRAIGVDVLTTFADVSVEDMTDSNTSAQTDDLMKVERQLYNEAGVSQMLLNTSGNLALEKSIANDEASLYNLLLQYEEFLNELIESCNKGKKKVEYRANLLTTTIYNYKELSKLYKEQTQMGYSKMLPQIALGQSQSSILANAYFENEVLDLVNLFVPPALSSTMSGTQSKTTGTGKTALTAPASDKKVGRTEKADDQKSEKTIQNKESMS